MIHWDELDIKRKIIGIFQDVPPYEEEHHMGRPFLTAYQIAIEYDHRHHEDVILLDLPVGGKDTGLHKSLAQYLARQLSKCILDGDSNFEGGFLSNWHLKKMVFDNDRAPSSFPTSVFRLRRER